MFKSRKRAILCCTLLGSLLLLISIFHFGLPQYSLYLAYRNIEKSHMVDADILQIYRPASDSYEDEHAMSGNLYSYILSLDKDNLYCARFVGSGNPFHGLFHLDPDTPLFRTVALGGYRKGSFLAAARGERTTAILPPNVATINHEGRCFIHNADAAAHYAKVRLVIHEAEGILFFDLPKAEKQGEIFPCILYAHTGFFQPTEDGRSLWLHDFHIVVPTDDSPVDLKADIGTAYIRAIGEGKQSAEVSVTFYDKNDAELYVDTYTLNPAATGDW